MVWSSARKQIHFPKCQTIPLILLIIFNHFGARTASFQRDKRSWFYCHQSLTVCITPSDFTCNVWWYIPCNSVCSAGCLLPRPNQNYALFSSCCTHLFALTRIHNTLNVLYSIQAVPSTDLIRLQCCWKLWERNAIKTAGHPHHTRYICLGPRHATDNLQEFPSLLECRTFPTGYKCCLIYIKYHAVMCSSSNRNSEKGTALSHRRLE